MQQILKLLFLTVSLLLAGGTWNDAYPQGHDVKLPRPTKPTTPVKPPRPNKPNRPTKPVKPNRPSKSRQQILDELVDNMVFVEGGTFTMGATAEQGSGNSDEKPTHSVTLSDYYIGKYEVTQAQWKAVMGDNPSVFVGDNLPVECVSWNDCQTFITKLNQLTGKNFRLPTEAEWEFAARGGNRSKGYKFAGSNDIGSVAWYYGNNESKIHPVGTKQPNELGLYDMTGNVHEWCHDWYGDYSSSPQVNPTGPSSGTNRVIRGSYCISRREDDAPTNTVCYGGHGFRLALSANTGSTASPSNQSSNVASSQMNNSTSMNLQSFTVNGVSFEMVKVEGGTFTMGATPEQEHGRNDDNKPVHIVTVSDFCIGKYEVTQAQWIAVMGSNPSNFKGDNLPVEMVSWNDCQTFIDKLNQLTGKCFRLPTEAEWEFAARGGNKCKGYEYSGSNDDDDVGYSIISNLKTYPVGEKQPNELGIYDMSGNVWEWCQDWYGSYSLSSQINPTGPSSGSNRVIRGGSCYSFSPSWRVSSRGNVNPTNRNNYIGFRIALSANTGSTALQSNQSSNVASSQMNNSTTMNPQIFTVNGVSFEMVKVEGGTFTMGATAEHGHDAYDNESPTHSVTLSYFYIGKYEVTQKLWITVMGSNPSSFKGDNLPVDNVSWNYCQTFINKLNQLTGKKFRLPTEAEWEYAARGGNKSKDYEYAGGNNIDVVGWYSGNSSSKTPPVGQKLANELGLYDMSGNVWEWCQDWYGSYSSSAQTNPTGPTSGSYRVSRGGGWGSSAGYCRVSFRGYYGPTYRGILIGFRLALSQ